jgi:hypothetical protein
MAETHRQPRTARTFDISRYAMTRRRWLSCDKALDLVLSAECDRATAAEQQRQRDERNAAAREQRDRGRNLLRGAK